MRREFSYDQRKEWAKTLYTKLDKGISEIAITVGADEVIVRSWIQEGRWNDVKRSLLISKEAQLERFYSAIERIYAKSVEYPDGELTIKDIDLVTKYTAAIKNLESETGISYIVQVAALFTRWLLHRDAVLAREVTAHFDTFITDLDVSRPKPLI